MYRLQYICAGEHSEALVERTPSVCVSLSVSVCEFVTKCVWVYMGVEENFYELVL